MHPRRYFITGIDTNVGKTVVSSIFVRALEADYWKPIQSGDLEYSDSHKIQAWAKHPKLQIHPERYQLKTPASPHHAAALENVNIQVEDFELPDTENHLIVEGAGGLFVPINQKHTIIELIQQLNIPVILVASYYLGSINHTLLSLSALREKNIPIAALVFQGNTNHSSRNVILEMNKDIVSHVIDVPSFDFKKNIQNQIEDFIEDRLKTQDF